MFTIVHLGFGGAWKIASIQAMCVGVPVVVADYSPGGARFLTSGGTVGGPIVPVNDADAMAEAISWMLDNRERAEELGRLGMALADKYPSEKVLDMWADLFEGLLGAPACRGKEGF